MLGSSWADLDFSIWSCTVNKPQSAVVGGSYQSSTSTSASGNSRRRPLDPKRSSTDRMERRRRASEKLPITEQPSWAFNDDNPGCLLEARGQTCRRRHFCEDCGGRHPSATCSSFSDSGSKRARKEDQ